MNEVEVSRVEVALGIRLPDAYRNVLLTPPYATDSWAALCIHDSADLLIENNPDTDLLAEFGVEAPDRHLYIGGDGSEVSYYLDLRRDDGSVFALDIESKTWELEAPSFTGWLEEMRAEEAELRRQASERAGRKPWWAFWRTPKRNPSA